MLTDFEAICMAMLTFNLAVTIYTIFAMKMRMTFDLHLGIDQGKCKINMQIESPYMTSFLMAIVMLV